MLKADADAAEVKRELFTHKNAAAFKLFVTPAYARRAQVLQEEINTGVYAGAAGATEAVTVLTPQQNAEIDRVYHAYPELNDDSFVEENLHRWLS